MTLTLKEYIEQKEDGNHAVFSASKAEQWMNCPASLLSTINIKQVTSKYANEGTAAHALGEECLKNNTLPSEYLGQTFEGVEVTDEMTTEVAKYIDYCNALREGATATMVERRVDYSDYAIGGFGTADFITLKNGHLHVVDLKYGKGIKVDAENNKQGQLYALGTLLLLTDLLGHKVKRVSIHIVQPRLNHFDEWQRTPKQILTFGNKVKKAANLCLKTSPDFVPTEKGCQWCLYKDRCKALAEHNLKIISDEFDDISNIDNIRYTNPAEVSAVELANLLPHINLITTWVKALEARAFDELSKGREIPNYKLVEGRSIRKWIDEGEASEFLNEHLGDKAYERKLLTPAKAEKIVGITKVKHLIVKPEGKPTLAPASDKRPAIKITPIEDEFEDNS